MDICKRSNTLLQDSGPRRQFWLMVKKKHFFLQIKTIFLFLCLLIIEEEVTPYSTVGYFKKLA